MIAGGRRELPWGTSCLYYYRNRGKSDSKIFWRVKKLLEDETRSNGPECGDAVACDVPVGT